MFSFSRCSWLLAGILASIFLAEPRIAVAQLVDVLETQNIRSDLESGQLGKNEESESNPADDSSDAEDSEDAAKNSNASASSRPYPNKNDPKKWDKWGDAHSIYREPLPTFSWIKLLLPVLCYVMWVGVADWVNSASQRHQLGAIRWNALAVFPGFLAGIVMVVAPLYALTAPLLVISVLAPWIAFVVVHNKSVERHQRVFTPEWFRYAFATAVSKIGVKMSAERKADYEKGPPVDLIARGAKDERADKANLLTARQSPGYVLVKELIADMALRRSERALLDYKQGAISVRHYVDGVWESGEARDRESGDVMLAVMKQLANLNAAERRAKQQGEFSASYEGVDYQCPLLTQGVKAGERVMLSLRGGHRKAYKTYVDLGMREKLIQEWSETMAADSGFVIISSLPEGGLTTLTDVALLETDRLMRDFFAIEDVHHPERDFENIEVVTYDSKANESPATLMPQLIRRYPNVYVVRDFVDAESAKILLGQVKEDRLVITTTHGRDVAEAILRVLQKKAPRKEVAETLLGVLNTRLIRLLCEECRVEYEPSADMLRKLGIPKGKVEHLYRTPKAEEIDKPCKQCNGSGYLGRTGLFEVLLVDDQVREVIVKEPKLDALRKAARTAGMRSLQEEGILLVAKGSTSLQELQRILKQ